MKTCHSTLNEKIVIESEENKQCSFCYLTTLWGTLSGRKFPRLDTI